MLYIFTSRDITILITTVITGYGPHVIMHAVKLRCLKLGEQETDSDIFKFF